MERDIRDNLGDTDQLIVRVGKACNFRCNFCNVSDNERNVKLRENIDDIVRNFHYKFKYSNTESGEIIITISGGEPSIFQKETVFALRYIRSFLEKRGVNPIFEIQTNASNIGPDFAKKLKENGIYLALVSFHMTDKDVFEKVIQIPYSNYSKIIDGIQNLHDAGIKIDTNTILSSENKDNFFPTLQFLEQRFPFIDTFNIGVIQPHGEAYKILDTILPRYPEIQSLYNKAIFYLRKHKRKVTSHYVGLPACYIEHYGTSLEVTDNTLFRKDFNFSEKHLINSINDGNKAQAEECHQCLYNNVCSGVWKEYIGVQKLNPTYYIKDFFGDFSKNDFAVRVPKAGYDVQKTYDSGARQVLIPSSHASESDIHKLITEHVQRGFYDITLLAEDNSILNDDLLQTGITNIQMDIEHADFDFIVSCLMFSQKFGLQFRVDVDIFIRNYSEENLKKIHRFLKLFPSDFLTLYFVYDYTNTDIFQYQDLLKILERFSKNVMTVNFYKNLLFSDRRESLPHHSL